MQGYRVVFILVGFLATVIGTGLLLGLRELPGGDGDDAESSAGVTVAPEAPPLPPPPAPEPQEPGHGSGRIEGRVLFFKTRKPARDVIVRLTGGPRGAEPVEAVSDAEGWFRFPDLPAGGGYEIGVTHGEFAPVRRLDVTVANAEITDVGLIFLEQAVTFVVEVKDGGKAAIPGAEVRVYTAKGPVAWNPNSWMERILKATEIPTPLLSVTAGEDGRAEVADIPVGYYSISAEADGFGPSSVDKLLSEETAKEPVEIVLGKGYPLEGTVKTEEGEPVPGRVLAMPPKGSGQTGAAILRRAVEIGEDGTYRFEALPPGSTALFVAREGMSPIPAGSVSVPDLPRFDITLGGGASVAGKVENAEGKPVEGAEVRVMVWTRIGQSFGATIQTDEEGAFHIDGLPTGNMNGLEVIAEGYARYPPPGAIREQVYLSPGAEVQVNVTLQAGHALEGRITRESDGAAVVGARVSAIPRSSFGGSWAVTTSNEDGSYVFPSLSPGEYALQVLAEGAYQAKFPSPWQAQRPQYDLDDRWKVRIHEEDASTDKDLVLAEGGTVSGRVEDSKGGPVAAVRLSLSNQSYGIPVFSGKDGAFEFTGVKEGEKLTVYAWTAGRTARSDPFGIGPAGRVEGLTLTLKASAVVEGRVETGRGTPPEGGSVRAVRGDPRRNPWVLTRSGSPTVPIGADGTFRIENVSPGQITLVASVPGFPPGMSDQVQLDEGGEALGVIIRVEGGLSVTGDVVTKRGEPVAGAQITVYKNRVSGQPPWTPAGFGSSSVTVAQSDAEGKFTLSGLSPGKYRVTAKKEGLTSASDTDVNPSSGDRIRLEMEAGGEISGRVLDRRNDPVGGMTVSLRPSDGKRRYGLPMTSTSPDGSFRLTGVPDGAFKVYAAPGWGSKLNYTTAEKDGVRPGETNVELRVEPGYPISGRVLDPDGQPASGLTIYANGPVSKWIQTEHDGAFHFPGLPEGEYTLTVQAGGGGLANASVGRIAAGAEGVEIRLSRAADIEGLVIGLDGMPISGVQIQAEPMPGTPGNNGSGRTGSTGRYKIRNLPPGAYRLTFTAPGRFVTAILDNIPAGSGGANVQMDEGLSISGVAVDEADVPIGRAHVTAVPAAGGGTATVSTKDDGTFEVRGLVEGKYRLTAKGGQGYVLEKPVEAEAGKSDVKLVLELGLAISGTVVDGDGNGIRWAWISCVGGSNEYAQTDQDGRFRFEGLKPGMVKLSVWAPGYSSRKTLDLQAGTRGVQIRMGD